MSLITPELKLTELTEKLIIATRHNEAIDGIMTRISGEEDFIKSLGITIESGEKDIDELKSQLAEAEKKQMLLKQHLRHSYEKKGELAILLKEKIDVEAINEDIEKATLIVKE